MAISVCGFKIHYAIEGITRNRYKKIEKYFAGLSRWRKKE
jgi:hypothetical protein